MTVEERALVAMRSGPVTCEQVSILRATDKAMARVSGEVIERVKARHGAWYREVIGAALARAGMLDLVEVLL